MRSFARKYLLLGISLASLAVYIAFVNPLLVKTLNIQEFDRAELKEKAGRIAEELLGREQRLKTRESITGNMEIVRNLERSVGLKSEAEIASTKIPVQFYTVNFFKLTEGSIFSASEDAVLSVQVDAHGDVSYLSYSGGSSILQKDAPELVKRFAKLLELDPAGFEQLVPSDLEKDEWVVVKESADRRAGKDEKQSQLYKEAYFRQKIEGVPLAAYLHSFKIGNGELVYQRDLVLKKNFIKKAELDLADFLNLLLWMALVFLSIVVLVLKLRRDEIDWSHFLKVYMFSTGLVFLAFVGRLGIGPIGILGSFFAGTLMGVVIALLFSLAESRTRESYTKQLGVADALLHGNWNIRETGRFILESIAYGNLFFLVPSAVVSLQKISEKFSVVIDVDNPLELEIGTPFSFFMANSVSAAWVPFVVSTMLFGILAPTIYQRFPNKWGRASVAGVFAAVACLQWQTEPATLCFFMFFAAGFALFGFWENYGFVGALAVTASPLVLQRALMMVMAKDATIAVEGMLLLLVFLALAAAGVWLVLKGKPLTAVKPYEPKYLRRIKEKERFERELEIAKHLQARLLPKTPPKLSSIEIATLCEPANEVGGDYFDFLELDSGKLLVFLGDVSGKGIRAAFYMTLAKGLLHGSFSLVGDHRELLKLLNRRFGALSEEGVFLTLITLTVDKATGDILVTSAGHNPPLLFKGGKVELLPSRGLVIGPMPDDIMLKSLQEYSFRMEKGDVLCLYTDGVTEAMNPAMEEYSTEKLMEVFTACSGGTASEIVNSIRMSVLEFTAGAPLSDDLTILVLKAQDDPERS